MKKPAVLAIALIVSLLLPAAPALAGKHGQKRGTPAQARAMVAKAVALFDKEGAEAAFDRFTHRPGSDFRHADLYIFVLKADKGGPLVAHGATPLARRPRGGHADRPRRPQHRQSDSGQGHGQGRMGGLRVEGPHLREGRVQVLMGRPSQGPDLRLRHLQALSDSPPRVRFLHTSLPP